MKCPRCGKEIGGYAELGSQAYQRVSQGRCPHCGGGMPSGYRVGFAAGPKQPTTYSKRDFDEAATGTKLRGIMVLAAMVLVILSLWLDGRAGGLSLGWVIGLSVLALLVCGALTLYYMTLSAPILSPMNDRVREDDMPHNTWGAVVMGGCLLLSFIMLCSVDMNRGRLLRLALYLPAFLLYFLAGPMVRKAQKRRSEIDEKNDIELLNEVIPLFKVFPEIDCFNCHREFRRLRPSQVILCTECKKLLCPECAGWHDSRHKMLALNYSKLCE